MQERLFQKSWHQVWSNMLREAISDVEKLDRRAFSEQGLAGVLKQIADKYQADIARFEGEVTAKRIETVREGRDGWGDYRTFKHKSLEVSIPFKGEAESFRIAPSRYTNPNHHADIGRNAVTITIPDDAAADQAVQSFMEIVKNNLDVLRTEYEQMKPQLQAAINEAVARRQAQIKAEQELDNKRSFRVVG
jgi:hypothetical protein